MAEKNYQCYGLTQAGSRCHHVFHLTTHTHGREPTIEDFYCAQHKAQAHVEETADGKSHRCVGHNVDGKHCHHIVGAGHGFFCPTHKDQDPYA